MHYQRPKGTADILPGQSALWQRVEATARDILARYRYEEIRTPLFENEEVFSRSAGDTSDIVTKEMYTFEDKGGRKMALRPEGTAGVVRAYVENKLYGPEFQKPYKVYYMGAMFRYERPQSGRQREFHQIGVEAFGAETPAIDAETIALGRDLLMGLGAKSIRVVINSLGDPESRAAYHEALVAYLTPYQAELSHDSQVRLVKNPLRILDSKDAHDQEIVKGAPKILDFLSATAQQHFTAVQDLLDHMGIAYDIDADMVRGLDYYNHTIFELMSDDPVFGGGYTTVLAGGRYNGLVEELGGPQTPGIGFGMGVERAMLLAAGQVPAPHVPVYIVTISPAATATGMALASAIRQQGFAVDMDYLDRKAKAQFKTANKVGADLVLTIGDSELEADTVQVKAMASGEQQTLPMSELREHFAQVYAQAKED
ncbi:histidine--tRNA ligase [Lacticaseibacillus nasuensis]|uniref:Histidine--tRNA ligase n=1 Tax=Lacticaseibacillus nasuensis JCM 17158 TaxID=1291734 RepID=A0A0R1JZR8_9LACO|nr:histidine--tRNA ligase [Lacticaseibacillus nasuensis]KRK73402.1 Histidyl-tRNA synthetase [Lacticaseibacillus nasuensis JCM 17158]